MNMNYRSLTQRFILVSTVLLVTFVSGLSPSGAAGDVLTIYASTAFTDLISDRAKAFMELNPEIHVKVVEAPAESGFQALLKKEADIDASSRKPNAVEISLAQKMRIKLVGEHVAWENVAVIANPDVTPKELTVDQIREIYTGVYTNWKDVGGADLSIKLHSMAYPQDDVSVWFASTILKKAYFAPSIIWVNAPEFLVEHVGVHKGAIGYLGNIQLQGILKRRPQIKVQLLAIRKDSNSKPFSPSAEISEKSKYPLNIPLYFYWNGNTSDKRIESFTQFCTEQLGNTSGK